MIDPPVGIVTALNAVPDTPPELAVVTVVPDAIPFRLFANAVIRQ